MFAGDIEVSGHALFKAGGVLLPCGVMEEDAHTVEADGLGKAEFFVDGGGVEARGLPHFELVDGGGGDEVATAEPAFVGVPGVGFFFGPDGAGGMGCGMVGSATGRRASGRGP